MITFCVLVFKSNNLAVMHWKAFSVFFKSNIFSGYESNKEYVKPPWPYLSSGKEIQDSKQDKFATELKNSDKVEAFSASTKTLECKGKAKIR